MVKKKREELSDNISYFREQFQDINRSIQLPESLKAENLLEKLEQQDQQNSINSVEPVKKLKLFFGATSQRWVAACGLLLVVGITSVLFIYGSDRSSLVGKGILLQSPDSASYAESAPQMAAYSMEEGESALDEAAPAPQSAPDEGLIKGRSVPSPESEPTEESDSKPQVQESAVPLLNSDSATPSKPNPSGKCEIPQPVYGTSKEEIKVAIQGSLNSSKNLNQKITNVNPLEGKGIQKDEVYKTNDKDTVNYDATSGVITFLSQDEKVLSTLKVTPDSAVFIGENVLSVLQQSTDTVQVTLYDVLNASAPKEVENWLQDGEFSMMTAFGGTFMLVTRIDVNQVLLDENRFIPKVADNPIEPADIEMIYDSSEQTQYQITTNFSLNGRQSTALLTLNTD